MDKHKNRPVEFFRVLGGLTVLLLLPGILVAQPVKVDGNLPDYHPQGFVSGTLNSIGSDTLNNLMTMWAEDFRKHHSSVVIQVEGKGSSTAPPALIRGTSQLGPMSRKMKSIEMERFEKKYGFKPTAIGVALDSLGVYVNKDNPITKLSLLEVDAIFSRNRRGGLSKNIENWGQLGLQGAWKNRHISLYGRNSASGTYGYFKEHALFKGDYKDMVKEQPGSASVVLGVTEDSAAIGYSGIGYRTSGVKAIAISKKKSGAAYEPTYDNVLQGKYPLGRMLYIYVAKAPNRPLSPLVKSFLTLVLSRQGQEIVVKDGYLPLPAKLAAKQLKLIN